MEQDHITVLIMHLLNLPAEPIPLHHIVVKLIPPRRPREFGAWELGERGEVEAIDEAAEDIESREDGRGGKENVVHSFFFDMRHTNTQYGTRTDSEIGDFGGGSRFEKG